MKNDLTTKDSGARRPVGVFAASPAVFSFDDAVDFLNAELRRLQAANRNFSLRSWARSLGYENPSYLSQVLRRQRKLKPDLARRLADSLELTGRSLRYFELLVARQAVPFSLSLAASPHRSGAARAVRHLDYDVFLLVSAWYHNAILEMPQLRDFDSDVDFIRRRLGSKISPALVKKAIDRLLKHGLLERTAAGGLARPGTANNLFDADIPSEAVRSQHKQWIDMARLAVDEQTMQERDLYGTTLSFRLADMPKAREVIRDAHEKLLALEAREGGDEVYQFSTQFFAVTRPLRKRRKPRL